MNTDNENSWFCQRGYLHFDRPISIKAAKKIVTSPINVSRHAFYPLITYSVVSKKIKRDKETNSIVTKEKTRPIAYASHVDSHIYSYYAKILDEAYEKKVKEFGLGESILAFRKLGKNNINFSYDAFMKIKGIGECGVVALDLSKFFETINHKTLKAQWSNLLEVKLLPSDHYNVFKSVTKYSSVDKDEVYQAFKVSPHNPKNGRCRICQPHEFRELVRGSSLITTNKNEYGIPQGSPISALLSNIYMIDFDRNMKEYVNGIGGAYFRYCDDMLFIVPIKHLKTVAGHARENLQALKVDINVDKTELRAFRMIDGELRSDKPLQYLGFIFDGKRILLRSSSLARYSEKMKNGVSLAKQTMRKANKIRVKNGEEIHGVYKRKLYSRYSHLGRRNFITYGLRAAKIMNSPEIRKQLKPLWKRLMDEIDKPA